MKTNRRESEVQAGVLAYLEFRPDFFFWRSNTGGTKFGKDFVKFGIPGAADIQGIQAPNGRFVGIECKREFGGKLSSDQEAWGRAVESAGGLYIVTRDVAAVERALGPVLGRVERPKKKRVYAR